MIAAIRRRRSSWTDAPPELGPGTAEEEARRRQLAALPERLAGDPAGFAPAQQWRTLAPMLAIAVILVLTAYPSHASR